MEIFLPLLDVRVHKDSSLFLRAHPAAWRPTASTHTHTHTGKVMWEVLGWWAYRLLQIRWYH